MPDVLGLCPVCGDELRVRRLACPSCQTAIEGNFTLGRLQRLSPEQLAFLEVFIKNRGVIREVERELGISYPTVRNRLDDLIRAFGFEIRDEAEAVREVPDQAARRREVLERLSRGELSADQAISLLKQSMSS